MNIMKPTVKVTVSSSTLIYSNTNTKIQTRVSKASVYFLFERNETALFICISTISLDSIFQRFLWVFSLICLDAAKNSLGSLKTLSSFSLESLSSGEVFWSRLLKSACRIADWYFAEMNSLNFSVPIWCSLESALRLLALQLTPVVGHDWILETLLSLVRETLFCGSYFRSTWSERGPPSS